MGLCVPFGGAIRTQQYVFEFILGSSGGRDKIAKVTHSPKELSKQPRRQVFGKTDWGLLFARFFPIELALRNAVARSRGQVTPLFSFQNEANMPIRSKKDPQPAFELDSSLSSYLKCFLSCLGDGYPFASGCCPAFKPNESARRLHAYLRTIMLLTEPMHSLLPAVRTTASSHGASHLVACWSLDYSRLSYLFITSRILLLLCSISNFAPISKPS